MDFGVVCIAFLTIHYFGIPAGCSAVPKEESLPQLPKPAARKSNALKPPVIIEQPSNILSMPSDTNKRLYCRVEGNPPPTISWLKDGMPLRNAEVSGLVELSGSLLFMQVRSKGKEQNTGTYQCIAKNSVGTARSHNVTVQVASIRSEFRHQPVDTIAVLGEQVVMECAGPRGLPEPDISWEKDRDPLQLDKRVQIRKGGNLVITKTRKSDAGTYACVASNGAGRRISNEAMLRVDELPKFTKQPLSQTSFVDKTLELKCQATGDPPPGISWTKDGKTVKYNNRVTLNNGNVRISPVEVDDQGEYTCTAKNRAGQRAASALVTINGPPKFTHVPSDTAVEVGATVTLWCRVAGNPLPKISWQDLNGNDIFSGTPRPDNHVVVTEDGDMVIYSVRIEDDGLYKCKAHNDLDEISTEVRLTVQPHRSNQPPPVVQRVPANTTASLGAKVTLQCTSVSLPRPQIVWFKDNRRVDVASSRSRHEISAAGSLLIRDIQKEDKGKYTCKVANDYGITAWDAWLSVSSQPGYTGKPNVARLPQAPSSPRLVNSTSKTIFISWSQSSYQGASPAQYYIVEYYRIGSSSTWKRLQRVIGTIYGVSDLEPSSAYVFLIRAVNQQGVSNPSPISEKFNTRQLGMRPPSYPSNTEQELLDRVSITLTQAISLSPPGTQKGSVRIMWTTESGCDDMDSFVIDMQPVTGAMGKLTKIYPSCSARTNDLTNIAVGVTYEVRIRPRKASLLGQPSPIAFVSLGSGRIEPHAPILTASVEEPSSIMFSWAPPSDLSSNRILGYHLDCQSTDGLFRKRISVNGTKTSHTLRNLAENVAYFATITYFTKLGIGKTSVETKVAFGVINVTPPSESGGFMETIQNQPGLIAGLAVGVLLLIGIIVGVWYYRRKRDRKASLHVRSFSFTPHAGSSRITSASRFGAVYAPAFQITPTAGDASAPGSNLNGGVVGGGLGPHSGNCNGPASSDNSRMFLERAPLNNPSSVRKNAVVTYDAKNGHLTNIDEKPTGIAHPTFSYVADQLTSVSDIPPQFASAGQSRPSLSSGQVPQVQQQMQQHHEQLKRHKSGSSNAFGSSVVSETDSRYPDASTTISNVRSFSDLPPPPPSPPLSSKTGISDRTDRSRGSGSGMYSSGDREPRGQRSKRRAHVANASNQSSAIPIPAASHYTSVDNSAGIDNSYMNRFSDAHDIPSPTPPTPPIRGASAYPYDQGMTALQFNNNQNAGCALPLMVGSLPEEKSAENDRIAQLRVRQYVVDSSQRNSVAVSAVSMMNTYGSETDEREGSSSGRQSPVSSDDESFHLESASQVGQNFVSHEEDGSIRPNPQPRLYKPTLQDASRHQYQTPYITADEENPLLAGHPTVPIHPPPVKPRPTRKTGNKGRRLAKKSSGNNLSRVNSGSSSASSSYHHNTGDSGMSAGVGCSTEHSSLNSNASAGSGKGATKVSRSWTSGNLSADYPATNAHVRAPGSVTLKRLVGHINQDGFSNPVSPTTSVVSDHSGYQSTASTCWQYHEPCPATVNQTPIRPPRISSTADAIGADSHKPSYISGSKERHADISLDSMCADRSLAYNDFDRTPANANIMKVVPQFRNGGPVFDAALAGKVATGTQQELSDVAEASTSDFCEDYSDQSQ